MQRFEVELNNTDRQLFLLMLNGVRDTEPYAEILQLTSLSTTEKRQGVKRAKDRLTKKLSRFVKRQQI